MHPDLLAVLRCPSCESPLKGCGDARGDREELACSACGLAVPVVNDIPRFVDQPEADLASRTQASFGYEWTHFNDWHPSGETNFRDYFGGIDLDALADSTVLDAGCGMGRHARQVAPFTRSLVAVDFSRAIDQAGKNVSGVPNVHCVQADLLRLPFADASFDFVYSLGVLHHLADTERALQALVRTVKPGGRLRIYLYWKRHGWSGRVLAAVALARHVTVRLSFPVLRVLCGGLSVGLYGIVVVYRLMSRAGVRRHQEWPLYVYTKYPFKVLYNDQFDRFSAPLEKRYDRDEVRALLEAAGLRDVQVHARLGWIGDGFKPA